MAIFTTADRDAVKAALITAAISGVASVTVGGETVQNQNLKQLQDLLAMIQSDLASSQPRGGMRFVKTIPPGAG
jgi:hypothetical protein